ncbi:MAG: MiaB/RimO family radical SAM methylthiotransferase [Candidatus Acididesulfobacter guangdongensis]|uniref:tRNA-2-methylthio-N(6)-dimethylallyladenosine synthase n=1 Tax=Acididesulfobacter guangdongensis TaxID=2597225 RepID=A0A519BFW0_ACIG2|nr:MAG: MiaB/RimO family radical SAM methylthiotransferase [Candidatus Acididesulfobacter guangdongensis]
MKFTDAAEDISFYIKTYGCQMNFHDSELLEDGLIFKGFKKAASLNDANIIILNTCSVRDNADHKILSDIGRITDKKKKIILAGCYAQQKIKQNTNIKNKSRNKDKTGSNSIIIAEDSGYKELSVNYYVSPEDILSIPDMLEKEFKSLLKITPVDSKIEEDIFAKDENYYRRLEKSFNQRSEKKSLLNYSQYLKITEGCNNFCSYCIVPYVRGAEKYIPLNILLKTVEKYAQKNVKEIILLGQNVNSYKSPENPDYNFAYLLKKIAEIKNIKKIKFLTSHPKDMSDEVIELIGKENKISKSLHLPVQSGSDRILKLMNRGYDRDRYINLIEKLKSNCPGILLSTDIIVGFPGETDEDFEQTLSLIKETGFEFIYGFQYSPRPFTAALNYKDDVPLEIKKERLNKLFNLQKNIFASSLNKLIGNYYDVIIEKIAENDDYNSEIINKGIFYRGITSNERVVYLKNFDIKKMSEFLLNSTLEKSESTLVKVKVKITEVVSNKLYGEVI